MKPTHALRLAWVLVAGIACPAMAQPIGDKPTYLSGDTSSVANQQAIGLMIWAPGLDDGYVPQGLTTIDGTVLLATYKSIDTKINTGPCRVFAVAMATGKQTGYFDMPESCGHAGGLTMIDAATLVVADTRMLYEIDLARALEAGHAAPALLATVKLGGLVKGSFVDFDGKDLWVGSSEKTADKSRAHRLSLQIFSEDNKARVITEAMALASITIPTQANGMAFDQTGTMWIAASGSKFGALYRLNPATGEVLGRHEVMIGIEDLSFDRDGSLWSVSEAGSRRWSKWGQTFPVIFRMDVSKLQ